jgi:hypothetical protein
MKWSKWNSSDVISRSIQGEWNPSEIWKLFNWWQFLGAFAKIAKSDYQLRHFCPFVRPSGCLHGRIRLQPCGYLWNLVFEYFSKTFRENWSIIKADKNNVFLSKKLTIHFFIISRSVFLIVKMFSLRSCRENQNTYFISNKFFSPSKIMPFIRYVEQYCSAEQPAYDNRASAHCMLNT